MAKAVKKAATKSTKKLPVDSNKLAKSIVDSLTDRKGKEEKGSIESAAAILGRKGGLVGGKARAAALTPKKRSEIAKKAAAARWKDNKKP